MQLPCALLSRSSKNKKKSALKQFFILFLMFCKIKVFSPKIKKFFILFGTSPQNFSLYISYISSKKTRSEKIEVSSLKPKNF